MRHYQTPGMLAAAFTAAWIGVSAGGSEARAAPTGEDVPWLVQRLTNENEAARRNAAYTLDSLGPDAVEAVPALARALEDEKVSVRIAAAFALLRIDPEQRTLAARALHRELRDAGADDRSMVLGWLTSSSGKPMPGVTAAIACTLNDANAKVRSEACEALLHNPPDADDDAVKLLARALGSADAEVRIATARTLGRLGTAAKEAAPALILALKDEQPKVRASAAAALLKVDPGANEAKQALLDTLQAEDLSARLMAIRALLSVAPTHPRASQALAALITDKDVGVRIDAVHTLYWIAKDGGDVGPAFCAALEDEDEKVVDAAANEARSTGPRARTAVPALARVLRGKYKHWYIYSHSCDALAAIGQEAAEAKPELLHVLKENADDRFVASSAAKALLRFDPKNREALDWFTEKMKDPWYDFRVQVACALSAVDPLPPEMISVAGQGLLRDKDKFPTWVLAEALGHARERRKEAVPYLALALRDKEERTREEAAKSLGEFGAEAEAALPALKKALADDSKDVRLAAATALGRMGSSAKEAVDDLLATLKGDSSGTVRVEAAHALGCIGDDSARLVGALTAAKGESDKRVRWAALEALERLGH
jgi:HEAT repeat protein